MIFLQASFPSLKKVVDMMAFLPWLFLGYHFIDESFPVDVFFDEGFLGGGVDVGGGFGKFGVGGGGADVGD